MTARWLVVLPSIRSCCCLSNTCRRYLGGGNWNSWKSTDATWLAMKNQRYGQSITISLTCLTCIQSPAQRSLNSLWSESRIYRVPHVLYQLNKPSTAFNLWISSPVLDEWKLRIKSFPIILTTTPVLLRRHTRHPRFISHSQHATIFPRTCSCCISGRPRRNGRIQPNYEMSFIIANRCSVSVRLNGRWQWSAHWAIIPP